jgi:hypothetical protein
VSATSPRSEFYEALYEAGHRPDAWVSHEALASVSLGCSLAVFVAAAVLAWKRPSEHCARQSLIPFDQSHPEEYRS